MAETEAKTDESKEPAEKSTKPPLGERDDPIRNGLVWLYDSILKFVLSNNISARMRVAVVAAVYAAATSITGALFGIETSGRATEFNEDGLDRGVAGILYPQKALPGECYYVDNLRKTQVTFTEVTVEPVFSEIVNTISLRSVNIGFVPHRVGTLSSFSRAPCEVLRDDQRLNALQAEQLGIILRHEFMAGIKGQHEFTSLQGKVGIISGDVIPAPR